MVQGDSFLEGISLRDETYDGFGSKWDRKVDPFPTQTQQQQQSTLPDTPNLVPIFHEAEDDESSSFQLSPRSDIGNGNMSKTSSTTGGLNPLLTAGLGQLTDKIEGASSFTMDLGYGLGKLIFYFYFTPFFLCFYGYPVCTQSTFPIVSMAIIFCFSKKMSQISYFHPYCSL